MTRHWIDLRLLKQLFVAFIVLYLAWLIASAMDFDFHVSSHASAQVAFSYRDLPSSDHAKNGHAQELYNAGIIADMFDNKDCEPQIDLCPEDKEIHWCEIRPGFSIALVIGSTVRQIITGYGASTNYWANRCPQT